MKLNSQIIAKQKRVTEYNLCPNKCAHCAETLDYDRRNLKFCDSSCSASHTNKHKIKHGKYAEKECVICKKLTTNPKYCCKPCMAIGQTKYTTEEEGLTIKRARGREAYARYSSRKKYQTPVDENLNLIKQFYKDCPVGFEVDHVVPISKGGQHSISNLQYLTISDNHKKNNKLNWCPRAESNG